MALRSDLRHRVGEGGGVGVWDGGRVVIQLG